MYSFQEYLDLAESLCGENTEAAHRSSISRAYYAFFHLVGREASSQDPKLKQAYKKSHKPFFNALGNSSIPLSALAEIGHTMRKHRNDADYDHGDIDARNSRKMADFVCESIRDRLADFRLIS